MIVTTGSLSNPLLRWIVPSHRCSCIFIGLVRPTLTWLYTWSRIFSIQFLSFHPFFTVHPTYMQIPYAYNTLSTRSMHSIYRTNYGLMKFDSTWNHTNARFPNSFLQFINSKVFVINLIKCVPTVSEVLRHHHNDLCGSLVVNLHLTIDCFPTPHHLPDWKDLGDQL